jgi:hypothetical protein
MTEKVPWSQAVRVPPREPSAAEKQKVDVMLGGRKVAALKRSQLCSFVSCKQTIKGFAVLIASRTIVHFSKSPSPRTFQDTTENNFEELNILNREHQLPLGERKMNRKK